MRFKYILMFCLVFLVSLPLAYSIVPEDLTPYLISYHSLDNSTTANEVNGGAVAVIAGSPISRTAYYPLDAGTTTPSADGDTDNILITITKPVSFTILAYSYNDGTATDQGWFSSTNSVANGEKHDGYTVGTALKLNPAPDTTPIPFNSNPNYQLAIIKIIVATNKTMYINNSANKETAADGLVSAGGAQTICFGDCIGGTTGKFAWDEIAILSKPLNNSEIDMYWNKQLYYRNETGWGSMNGSIAPPFVDPTTTYTVTAIDLADSTAINSFSVNVSNSSNSWIFYTNNGTTYIHNHTINNWEANYTFTFNSTGYYGLTYNNIYLLDSGSTQGNLSLEIDAAATITNYIFNSGQNYTRNLSYSINISCPDYSHTNILLFINNTNQTNISVSCNNAYQLLDFNYLHSIEGNYTLALQLDTNLTTTINTILYNGTFLSDLYNPVITMLNFTNPEGFSAAITNTTLSCTDKHYNNITFNSTFNNILLAYKNVTAGTLTNETNLLWGSNTLIGTCWDLFGYTTDSITKTSYSSNIILIDEKDNTIFNIDNITGARVYFDTNRSYYDFKTTNTTQINFTTENNVKLRFELTYSDGSIITRYVDVSLIDNQNMRVCANKEGVNHYQQLIVAATERVAILKNLFSDCVIAADYVRFAYQDALVLQSYSIESLYYLYTYDSDGNQIFLSALDGSIATYINIDQLILASSPLNLNILQDAITFSKVNDDEIKIYYQNLEQDNTGLNLVIANMDTNAVVFTTSDFVNPNEFTLYFDYSTLANVTDSTLFELTLTKTTEDGQSILTRYFNTNGSSGRISSFFAAILSFFLTIFGLTFAAVRITFSWFGIIITLASIGILAFSVSVWYITLLMGMNFIILIFIILQLTQLNYSTLT